MDLHINDKKLFTNNPIKIVTKVVNTIVHIRFITKVVIVDE